MAPAMWTSSVCTHTHSVRNVPGNRVVVGTDWALAPELSRSTNDIPRIITTWITQYFTAPFPHSLIHSPFTLTSPSLTQSAHRTPVMNAQCDYHMNAHRTPVMFSLHPVSDVAPTHDSSGHGNKNSLSVKSSSSSFST